jgi:hypothetical protein
MAVSLSPASQKALFKEVFGPEWTKANIDPLIDIGAVISTEFTSIKASYKTVKATLDLPVNTSSMMKKAGNPVVFEQVKKQVIDFIHKFALSIAISNVENGLSEAVAGAGIGKPDTLKGVVSVVSVNVPGAPTHGASGGGGPLHFSGGAGGGGNGTGGASAQPWDSGTGFGGGGAASGTPFQINVISNGPDTLKDKAILEENKQLMAAILKSGADFLTPKGLSDTEKEDILAAKDKAEHDKALLADKALEFIVDLAVPKPSKAKKSKDAKPIPPSSIPVVLPEGVVKLRDAVQVGQKVAGTDPASIYTVMAINPRVKLAARIKGSKISIRAEFDNALNDELMALHNLGMTEHDTHFSVHMGGDGVPPGRIIGAFLFDCGITFDQQIKNVTELQ